MPRPKKKILVIAYNTSRSYETLRIVEESKKAGLTCTTILWKELVFDLSTRNMRITTAKGADLKKFDFVWARCPDAGARKIRRGKYLSLSRLYGHFILLAEYLDKTKTRVLNGAVTEKLEYYNKLHQYVVLHKAKFPTVPSLVYTGEQVPKRVYRHFKKPYIVKAIYGAKGKNVFKIDDEKKIRPLIKKYGFGQVMVQKYLPITCDYRVMVFKGAVLGTIKRTSVGKNFKTNFSLGGTVESLELPLKGKKLAIRTAKLFNADIAGVDLIEYNGTYYILEINLFSGFEGFETATGKNVPETVLKQLFISKP